MQPPPLFVDVFFLHSCLFYRLFADNSNHDTRRSGISGVGAEIRVPGVFGTGVSVALTIWGGAIDLKTAQYIHCTALSTPVSPLPQIGWLEHKPHARPLYSRSTSPRCLHHSANMGEQLKFRGQLVAHEDWVTSIAATSEVRTAGQPRASRMLVSWRPAVLLCVCSI